MSNKIPVFLALLFASLSAFSQTKEVEKAVIITPYVQCDKCKEQVEFFIGHEYGVVSVMVNTRKHTTTVSWLTDRTTLNNIRAAIANLGFDADDIEAEPFAFKRLPKECKAHKENAKPKPLPQKDSVGTGHGR